MKPEVNKKNIKQQLSVAIKNCISAKVKFCIAIMLFLGSLTATPPFFCNNIRQIAEFEPMEGVLIKYPLGIPLQLVKLIAQQDKITVIIASTSRQEQAQSDFENADVNLNNCRFWIAPSDS